jgi:hypothetical protein
MKNLIILSAVILAIVSAGCANNINATGLYAACSFGVIGYGTFTCSKDNVSVKSSEETTKDGVKSTNEFTVGKQTTGYDVELAKAKK